MKNIPKQPDELFIRVSEIVNQAKKTIATTANLTMVYAYFEIGRMIVEDEQGGVEKPEYGKATLKELSKKLIKIHGNGFSLRNLEQMRKFYLIYSSSPLALESPENQKTQTVSAFFQKIDNQLDRYNNLKKSFYLSWSHYLILMRIENTLERCFYEKESYNSNWSVRELERQVNSSLFERLALSRNKDEVLRLAREGQIVEKPTDILKSPIMLDFLGFPKESSYTESDLEQAIISKLQNFLLELGKGFLFEARQKRFTFDDDNYYIDLVFYNRILQCYVLIDLKTDKLSHQDIGQMQMYVNFYDRHVKLENENKTIGILLCKQKKDALVKLTLPEGSTIHASEYSLYLPNKQLLREKLSEWSTEFDLRA